METFLIYQLKVAVLAAVLALLYKLLLVTAVASAQGIKMGNWLKKTKLKNRIDMMERKESNRWNML